MINWKELTTEEILETAQNVAVVSKFLNGETPLPVDSRDENTKILESLRKNAASFISSCFESLQDPRVDLYFSTSWISVLNSFEPSITRGLVPYRSHQSVIGLRRTQNQTPVVYLMARASQAFCEHPSREVKDIDPQELKDLVFQDARQTYEVVRSFKDEGWVTNYKQGTDICLLERDKQRSELYELDARFDKARSEGGPNWPSIQERLNGERSLIHYRKLVTDPLRTVTLTRTLTPDDIVARPLLVVPFIRGLNKGFIELKSRLLGELKVVDQEDGLLRLANGFEQAYQILEQAIKPNTTK